MFMCVSDCLTDIRQSLAAPRLISKPDAVTASVTSTTSCTTSTGTGSNAGLGELLRKMHSSLVSQVKSVLTHLQVSCSSSLNLLVFHCHYAVISAYTFVFQFILSSLSVDYL